ncbi:MAG: hypothetical protein IKO72_00510 [Kiritimatiellae bacterium]|nr:hypothetical protein [Kiritimatiellia bacterium]
MTGNEKYITQLTRDDLKGLRRAMNPEPGIGISIEKRDGSFVFSIDQNTLKIMIWTFLQNGGQSAALADLAGISLDPGNTSG